MVVSLGNIGCIFSGGHGWAIMSAGGATYVEKLG